MAAPMEHVAEQVCPVRDNAIHAELQETVHLGGIVDGPDMNHQAKVMGAPKESRRNNREPPIADWNLKRLHVAKHPAHEPAEHRAREHRAQQGEEGI